MAGEMDKVKGKIKDAIGGMTDDHDLQAPRSRSLTQWMASDVVAFAVPVDELRQ